MSREDSLTHTAQACLTLQHTATHFVTHTHLESYIGWRHVPYASHTATHCNTLHIRLKVLPGVLPRLLDLWDWTPLRCGSVLRCATMCCSALQCVAVCYSVLQCVAVCCSVMQRVARPVDMWDVTPLLCCSVLQCDAVCCSVVQTSLICLT